MAALSAAARKLRQAKRQEPAPLIAAQGIEQERPDFPTEVQAALRARIRDFLEHLERLANLQRPDFAQVDRLASALERLTELERVLDGRPLPGTRRPPRDEGAAPSPARPRGLPPPAARPADELPSSDDDDEPAGLLPAPID